uniref:Uncharacterized protein n=1 Tax=Avena sativa TaxID=4498 RepID=A0ACD5WRG6_AVESA
MAGQLATVPEESADGSAAAYPPRSLYRDSIRRVGVSGSEIRKPTLLNFSECQSDYSGSSYSGSSGCSSRSAPSCSSRSAHASAAEVAISQLEGIATQMVRDGYIRRMFEALDIGPGGGMKNFLSSLPDLRLQLSPIPALEYGDVPDRMLDSWFSELDVAWVLQIRQEHGSQWQLRVQDDPGSSLLQDLVERWIRGLTVIIHSLTRSHSDPRFGEASIFKMLVFVDAMIPALKAENIQAVLDMYKCVRWAFGCMVISHSE